jgi:formate C-acetyltransferase
MAMSVYIIVPYSRKATETREKRRLEMIAQKLPPRSPEQANELREAIQSLYMTLLVGTIQYGTHEVFAVGRTDQYLYPFYKKDIESGLITRDEAKALLQELFLKLEAEILLW